MLLKFLFPALLLFPLSAGAQLYDNNFLSVPSMIQGDYRYSQVEKFISTPDNKNNGFYLKVDYDSTATGFRSWQEIEMRKECPVCIYTGPLFNEERSKRMMLRLVNATDSNIMIVDESFNLSIIQEAKDRDGVWKPVEFWKRINCECNANELMLRRNEMISFAAYRYKGDFETEMRFKVRIIMIDPKAKNTEKAYIFYSDIFSGSISENQFNKPNIEGISFLNR